MGIRVLLRSAFSVVCNLRSFEGILLMANIDQDCTLVAFYRKAKTVVPITPQKHNSLIRAKEALSFGLDLELRFDLLLENYAELERYIMRVNVDNAIFVGRRGKTLSVAQHQINRHMVNLLTSARLYLDQTATSISRFPQSPQNALSAFRSFTNDEYDRTSPYRIMEALRNYTQHCGLPAHFITFGTDRDDSDPDGIRSRHTVSFGLMTTVLRHDAIFKKSALGDLDELADENGRVAALPIIREYLTSLSSIHSRLRHIFTDLFQTSEEAFTEIYDELKTDSDEAPHTIYSTRTEGSNYEEFPINRRLVQERSELEAKSKTAGPLGKKYVTSI